MLALGLMLLGSIGIALTLAGLMVLRSIQEEDEFEYKYDPEEF